MTADLFPPATLALGKPYAVPDGGRLVFRATRDTTDGFERGDVVVLFADGRPEQVVARTIPATGGARSVKALGDYAKLFPEPLPRDHTANGGA